MNRQGGTKCEFLVLSAVAGGYTVKDENRELEEGYAGEGEAEGLGGKGGGDKSRLGRGRR